MTYPWAKVRVGLGLAGNHLRHGAKVILQGPCTYEVDSAAGGFLSVGKLTALSNQDPRPKTIRWFGS